MKKLRLRYFGEFKDRTDMLWRVELYVYSDVYVAEEELTFPADSPLIIEWPETAKEEPLCGSTATLTIESPGDRTYIDLIAMSPGDVVLRVLRKGSLYWTGTLDTEFYEEPYERYSNYDVSLTFSDFGAFSRMKFTLTDTMIRADSILTDALGRSNLRDLQQNYDYSLVSTYLPNEEKVDLANIAVQSANFYDEDGEPTTVKEALTSMMQPLGLKLIQRGGKLWIYDLNGLATADESTLIRWSSDSQLLSVDKMYNRIKLTVSTYSSDGKIVPIGAPSEVEYTGNTEELDDSFEGEYVNSTTSPVVLRRTEKIGVDEQEESIFVHYGEEGKGVKLHAGQYCRITPILDGSEEDCVAFGFYSRDANGDVNHINTLVEDFTNVETNDPPLKVYTSHRFYIPPATEGTKKNLRLTVETLFSGEFNPWAPDHEHNRKDVAEAMQQKTAFYMIPVNIQLYANNYDEIPSKHFCNRHIAYGARKPWPRAIDVGQWENGGWKFDTTRPNQNELPAWLSYYKPDNLNSSAIGDWAKNRHNLGRADIQIEIAEREFINHESYADDKYYYYGRGQNVLPADWVAMEEGELIPYPLEGGWLEITVFAGLAAWGLNEQPGKYSLAYPDMRSLFNSRLKWTDSKLNLYNRLRWALYKSPQLEIVEYRNGKIQAETADDIEYSGVVNEFANDDLSIDCNCGTSEKQLHSAKAMLYFLNGTKYSHLSEATRAGRSASPEDLLIGTLCSQYGTRHTKLSGEADIITGGLQAITEANQEGKLFTIIAETQDIIEGVSETTIVELSPDEYTAE